MSAWRNEYAKANNSGGDGQVTVDHNVYMSVNGGRRRLKVVQGGLNPDGLER
jgi:hypothetical protein